MQFKPGQSGNPKGRPKGTVDKWKKELESAIRRTEKAKDQKFLDRVMEKAWNSEGLMIAILKKIVPDCKSTDQTINIVTHDDWIKRLDAARKASKK